MLDAKPKQDFRNRIRRNRALLDPELSPLGVEQYLLFLVWFERVILTELLDHSAVARRS
jgi:hypothetical protein